MKKAIYTAIFGGYDTLKHPTVINPDWDYICYTDSNIKSDLWDIRRVKVKKRDKVLYPILARSCKMNPPEEYDITIWHDASLRICSDPDNLASISDGITAMKHPSRDCIYREAQTCHNLKLITEPQYKECLELYRNVHLPEGFGLTATGFIVQKDMKEFNALWREVFKRLGNTRDQLSFDYVRFMLNKEVKQIDYNSTIYGAFQYEHHSKPVFLPPKTELA